MKAARLVVLGVALAAGGVAAFLASSHREAPPPAEPPPPPLATVDVLIAKNDLPRGQIIGEADIDWQMWPAAAANPSFIKRTDRFSGKSSHARRRFLHLTQITHRRKYLADIEQDPVADDDDGRPLKVRTPDSSHQDSVRPIRRKNILMVHLGFPIHWELDTEGSAAFLITRRGIPPATDPR